MSACDFDDGPAGSVTAEELRPVGKSYAESLLRRQLFPVVMLAPIFIKAGAPHVSSDTWRWVNLAGRVSRDAAIEIRLEAKQSLQMMLSCDPARGFHHLFISRVPFWQRFDQFVQVGPMAQVDRQKIDTACIASVHVPRAEKQGVAWQEWAVARADCPDWTAHVQHRAQHIVERALGGRALLVRAHLLTSVARFGANSSLQHRQTKRRAKRKGSGETARRGVECCLVSPTRPERGWGDLAWGLEEDGYVGWQRCWATGGKMLRRPVGPVVVLGIVLDPSAAEKLIIKGPAAENKPAAMAFRSFWGKKAELRRFKDGSIVEVVSWERECSHGFRGQIIGNISEHVLKLHHPFAQALSTCEAPAQKQIARVRTLCGYQLEFVSRGGKRSTQPNAQAGTLRQADNYTGRARMETLRESFAALARVLREISHSGYSRGKSAHAQLPLTIKSVKLSSRPGLRYTSAALPYARTNEGANVFDCVDVVMQFESSSSWPNGLRAIVAAKTAFYVRIAELLEQRTSWRCVATREFLDVIIGGCAFRLHIRHDREWELLRIAAQVWMQCSCCDVENSLLFFLFLISTCVISFVVVPGKTRENVRKGGRHAQRGLPCWRRHSAVANRHSDCRGGRFRSQSVVSFTCTAATPRRSHAHTSAPTPKIRADSSLGTPMVHGTLF